MNERILKLAEQAGAETWSRAPMRAVTGLAFTDENLEKFAELIVEECTTVIDRTLFQNIGWNTSRAVRRHFGIEDEE
jgi:hypothetical protein